MPWKLLISYHYYGMQSMSTIEHKLYEVLTKELMKTQSLEQAGIRNRYSSTDHIHVVNQLKCRYYNIPLCMGFIYYFNSVQTQAILTSLQEPGMKCVELLKDSYNNSPMTVYLHNDRNKINTKRSIRQGDSISHKLFTVTPENICRRLNWKTRRLRINDEYLSYLPFPTT